MGNGTILLNQKLNKLFLDSYIGKIKVFRILAEKYRNRRKYYDLRMKLICGIYNFELK